MSVKGWEVRYGMGGGGELGDVSHYWEMDGSIGAVLRFMMDIMESWLLERVSQGREAFLRGIFI